MGKDEEDEETNNNIKKKKRKENINDDDNIPIEKNIGTSNNIRDKTVYQSTNEIPYFKK